LKKKSNEIDDEQRRQILGSGLNGIRYLLGYVDGAFREIKELRKELKTLIAQIQKAP
jgi:hypothetical protein